VIKLVIFSIIAAAYGAVSDFEVVFFLTSLAGLIFSILNLRWAIGDLTFLKRNNIKGARRKLALTAVKSEAARAAIQTFFVTAASFSFFLPSNGNELKLPTYALIFNIIIRYGFLASTLLLTLKSYWSYQVRREIIETDEANGKSDETNELL
jgi:hypothetical protein